MGTGQTLDFTGGLTVQPGGTLTGTGTAGGTITNAGGTVSPGTGTFTLGSLTQSSGLTDVAAGETLTITGAHNQSGGTTPVEGALTAGSHAISGGSMTVNGTVGGAVTLTATGVLAGSGQVNGNVTNTSGSVRPGNSPGHLTVAGNFLQSTGGTLQIEVDGTAAFDQLEVTGVATLRRNAGDRQRLHAREHRHVPDRHVGLAQRHVRDGDRCRPVRRRLPGRPGVRRAADRHGTAGARGRHAAGDRHHAGRPDRHLQPGHVGQQPDVHVRMAARRHSRSRPAPRTC